MEMYSRDRDRGESRAAAYSSGCKLPIQKAAYRKKWVSSSKFKEELRTTMEDPIDKAIKSYYEKIDKFYAYNMQGSQSAKTNAEGHAYTTKDTMHSEMVALTARLNDGTYGLTDRVTPPENGFHYTTTEPHCGHCTFFLKALDLPLGRPTKGLFNYASQNLYPLPPEVRAKKAFVEKVLKQGTEEVNPVDNMLLPLAVSNPDQVTVTWKEFDTKGYLDQFWTYFKSRIYEYLRN